MPRQDVELIRRGYESWRRGDLEAWLDETTDPEVEWDISAYALPDVPNRGRGREAFRAAWLTYLGGWNDYSPELKEVSEAGEHVLVVIHEAATVRDTGVPLERDLAYLWTVRDGKAALMRVFRTRTEALEAAGFEE